MNDIRQLTKRRIKENIFLSLLLLFFCITNIVVNINIYKKVLFGEYTMINSYSDLQKAYESQDKYLTVNLSKANLEHYKLENIANIYTLKLENNVLVFLKENTLLTDKVNVEIINNDSTVNDVLVKLNRNNYSDIVLSNINFNKDINFEKYKIYALAILCIISLLSVLINIIKNIKPEKTRYYKKIMRKYYN